MDMVWASLIIMVISLAIVGWLVAVDFTDAAKRQPPVEEDE